MRELQSVIRYNPSDLDLPEEASGNDNILPPASWPEFGTVKVNNLAVRYSSDADFVLSDVSFAISRGEKLAVVGRTG